MEATVTALQLFVPILATIVGAAIACSSVPLNQWFNLRATLSQWLREQRARVYADPVDSVDNLASKLLRMAKAPSAEQEQLYEAFAAYARACSVRDLYAPPGNLRSRGGGT
jgi:hypothetical protein